ncbi:MAG: bifunctional riboflavin kinase/FAD synthetase [Candidatus Omnitrophota bacterium]
MKVIYGINKIPKKSALSVITVGVFDGVHIGHQQIMKELLCKSKEMKAESVVVTFFPHPDKILKEESAVSMITSLSQRLNIIESMGIDKCLVINFTKAFSAIRGEVFLKNILLNKLNMKSLIVGENFSFGSDKALKGNALKRLAEKYDFKLGLVKEKKRGARIISSSYIRHLIEKGKFSVASKLLARDFSIYGTVVKGRRRGRVIGFKTANLDLHHEVIPPSGVYAAYAILGNKKYKSIMNIGTRPTFDEKEPSVEVHLFDINKNIYGKDLEIFPVNRLRAERRFKSKEHLRDQISQDVLLSKEILH